MTLECMTGNVAPSTRVMRFGPHGLLSILRYSWSVAEDAVNSKVGEKSDSDDGEGSLTKDGERMRKDVLQVQVFCYTTLEVGDRVTTSPFSCKAHHVSIFEEAMQVLQEIVVTQEFATSSET